MQIPNADIIRKSVVFICYQNDKNIKIPVGTGFFINIESSYNKDHGFTYLTTAKHIIANIQNQNLSKDGNIWIRINKKLGGHVFVSKPITDFINHPNTAISVDVSMLGWTPDTNIYDFTSIPEDMILTNDIIEENAIGVGDEVFITGLFINHYGKEKNIPIIRIGNISAMVEEPIYSPKFGNMEANLIELRSLGGLSGSPVFVNLMPIRRPFKIRG